MSLLGFISVDKYLLCCIPTIRETTAMQLTPHVIPVSLFFLQTASPQKRPHLGHTQRYLEVLGREDFALAVGLAGYYKVGKGKLRSFQENKTRKKWARVKDVLLDVRLFDSYRAETYDDAHCQIASEVPRCGNNAKYHKLIPSLQLFHRPRPHISQKNYFCRALPDVSRV